ncbi:MAG TPA: hypothetical protein VKV79_01830 [Terriglobia bacterium]|nr:hypothetical protein [Terriglobia bacterium]
MGNLAQLDLQTKGGEARTRALLEDLVAFHRGVYPKSQLALAVWFGKSLGASQHNLLELYTGSQFDRIRDNGPYSLLWKTGSDGPPFVNLSVTSVDSFTKLLQDPAQVGKYFDRFEVLYFDKGVLNEDILRAFNIVTEPSGLLKGWYIEGHQYSRSQPIQPLLARWRQMNPHFGLVKIYESPDFENCRGLLHIEVEQRWLPLTPDGLQNYKFDRDWQEGQPGYFLFEGGALYQILRFEVKTVPEYASRVLEKLSDDRYPEVYLRAVHPVEQPTA